MRQEDRFRGGSERPPILSGVARMAPFRLLCSWFSPKGGTLCLHVGQNDTQQMDLEEVRIHVFRRHNRTVYPAASWLRREKQWRSDLARTNRYG